MWRMSGIHRDVHFMSKPAVHISDVHVCTPLTFESPLAGSPPVLAAAQLQLEVRLSGPRDDALRACRLLASLFDEAGRQQLAPEVVHIETVRAASNATPPMRVT